MPTLPPSTSGSDWSRTDAALDALLALPAGEREAAIGPLAAGDAAFEAELRLLLAGLQAPDARLDRPARDALFGDATPWDAHGPSLKPGTRLGAWQVQELLGRGGMGEVYRAQRADGQYEQAAAIKLMRADVAPWGARFQAERQIVARLTHPGIAQLLDGGMADDGRAYMAMELVDGRPITAWCAEQRAPLARRLALFVEVCEAVAYAHRNLVVHRDLKPANVFVNMEGRVKLMDFGVARMLDAPSGEATREVLLTPAYASPEQLSGGAITTAADVYALGLLLHELLCGQQAFAVQSLPLAAAMQRVLTQPPEAPSQVAQRQNQPPVPAQRLSGDLDAIVAKALRKEPAQRYATVEELRSDVERHTRQQPVLARRGNWRYVAGLALQRHRAWAAGALVAVAALLAGGGATLCQARLARIEAGKAAAERDFLLGIFEQNSVKHPTGAQARKTTAEELLAIGTERIRTQLKDQPEVRDSMMGTIFQLYDGMEAYDKALSVAQMRLADLDANRAPASLARADAQFALGRSLFMTGQPGAQAAFETTLHTLDTMGDRTSLVRADVLLHLARLAYRRRAPGDEQLAAKSAAEAQVLYPAGDENRIYAGQLRARVLSQAGQSQAAADTYKALLGEMEAAGNQGANWAVTLAALYVDLGSVQLDLMRIQEGEAMLKMGLDHRVGALGPDAPSTQVAHAEHAKALLDLCRGAEAQGEQDDALRRVESTRGSDDLLFVSPMRNAALAIAIERGAWTRARPLVDQGRAFYAAHADERGRQPAFWLLVAQLLLDQKLPNQALEALAQARKSWPGDARSDGSLAEQWQVLQARTDSALGRADSAVRTLEGVRLRHPLAAGAAPAREYALATLALAQIRLDQQEPRMAADLLQSLLQAIAVPAGAALPCAWEARPQELLGRASRGLGRSATARASLQRAEVLRSSLDDPDSEALRRLRLEIAQVR